MSLTKKEQVEREKKIKERQKLRGLWQTIPRKPRSAKNNLPIGLVQPLSIKVPKHGLKIAVVTDVQARKKVPLDHLNACGDYLAHKQPDVIMVIGDFWDFPSLSRFNRGTRLFEGLRYKDDLDAGHDAMERLITPIYKRSGGSTGWNPKLEFTLGNHEDHVERATIEDAKLEGTISLDDLELKDYGFRVHPFLQPVSIGGVAFCHYFPSGVMGKAVTSAPILLSKYHMSAFAGHQQGREIAYAKRADGSNMTAIISGSFYQHDCDYLSPFTNKHWRGMYMLHEVKDGSFDEMAVSINFLKRKFKARRRK